jgi:hypothetical protein
MLHVAKAGKTDTAKLMPGGLTAIWRAISILSVQSAKELLIFIASLLTISKHLQVLGVSLWR